MNWQPIETAPKDGTEVLLWVNDENKRMVIVQAKFVIQDNDDKLWKPVTLTIHGCGCCGFPNEKPTHWMPLLEPPKC